MEVGGFDSKGHGDEVQISKASQKQERSVKSPEASALKEEEVRKEEFFKLFLQVASKEDVCKVLDVLNGDTMKGKDYSTEIEQTSNAQVSNLEDFKLSENNQVSSPKMFFNGEFNGEFNECQEQFFLFLNKAIANGAVVMKNKDWVLRCVQESSREILRRKEIANEDVQVGFPEDEEQGTITRIYEHSKCSKEREGSFCPMDKRPSVNSHVGVPQGGTVHSSLPSVPGFQGPLCHHTQSSHLTPCMAAEKDKGMSHTLPHESTPSKFSDMPLSNCVGNNSGNFDKGVSKKDSHVTRLPYADIVKAGKQSPTHVNILHNVPCIGNSGDVAQAVQNEPCHSPRQDTLAPSASAVSGNENFKQDFCLPAPSKEVIPLLKIDNDILNKRLSLCKFSIIGKVSLAKGEQPWSVQKLRDKLEAFWQLHSTWRLIGLGKGFFQILLLSRAEWDKVWARGSIHLKPGTMRLQRWSLNFDPLKEKTSFAQVWFRIFQLPWGLWDPNVIFGIASKVGVPLKIDNATLNGDFGYYARVLVDVDMSTEPISEVHIDCGIHKFEVKLSPENLPSFCSNCHTIGHCSVDCRHLIHKTDLSWQPKQKRGGEPNFPIDENVCTKVSKTDYASTRRKEPIVSHKKARNEVVCFDAILGSNFVDSSVAFRIVDESVTKEVFNVMGFDKKGQQAPNIHASEVGMPSCTTKPAIQDSCKGESITGKNGFAPQIESPNRFSALIDNEDSETSMATFPNIQDGDRGSKAQLYDKEEENIPKIPPRWSDIMDEEDVTDKSYTLQDVNDSFMQTRSNIEKTFCNIPELRSKLQEEGIWLSKEDIHYDRDMCAEIEHYKNSAKATKAFIAQIPKKDKKVKLGFRHPQGKHNSPK